MEGAEDHGPWKQCDQDSEELNQIVASNLQGDHEIAALAQFLKRKTSSEKHNAGACVRAALRLFSLIVIDELEEDALDAKEEASPSD